MTTRAVCAGREEGVINGEGGGYNICTREFGAEEGRQVQVQVQVPCTEDIAARVG